MKHLKITISGKVQGVFFRAKSREEARRLELKGFVCNRADGKVYIEAEGTETALEAMLQWCQTGPPLAVVQHVHFTEGSPKNFESFEIEKRR